MKAMLAEIIRVNPQSTWKEPFHLIETGCVDRVYLRAFPNSAGKDCRPPRPREAAFHKRRRRAAATSQTADPRGPRIECGAHLKKTLMKTFSAKPAEVKHEWFVI